MNIDTNHRGVGASRQLGRPKASSLKPSPARMTGPGKDITTVDPSSNQRIAPTISKEQSQPLPSPPTEHKDKPKPTYFGHQATQTSTGVLFLEPLVSNPYQESIDEGCSYVSAQPVESTQPQRHIHAFQGELKESDMPQAIREAWSRRSDIGLAELFGKLFAGSGVNVSEGRLIGDTEDPALETWEYRLKLKSETSGRTVGQMNRCITFSEDEAPEVSHDLLKLQPEFQDKNLAKELLSRSVEVYDQIGIEKVTLTAGLTVGGYAWAKYGFKPDSPEETWELWDQVQSNLEDLSLSARTRNLVSGLLRSDDPKTVWTLSDLGQQVEDEYGEETTLGKALLMGTAWCGELDLTDSESRQRFDQYTNRHRTTDSTGQRK